MFGEQPKGKFVDGTFLLCLWLFLSFLYLLAVRVLLECALKVFRSEQHLRAIREQTAARPET
jgi:hypothetical protein